jgi:hypothetical protein
MRNDHPELLCEELHRTRDAYRAENSSPPWRGYAALPGGSCGSADERQGRRAGEDLARRARVQAGRHRGTEGRNRIPLPADQRWMGTPTPVEVRGFFRNTRTIRKKGLKANSETYNRRPVDIMISHD